MARKVGALSIIGLLVLILSAIVYFSAFTITDSYQDFIIGIVGIILGFVSIIVDYFRAKRKDTLNEIHSKLDVYGTIVAVAIAAWFIDVIFFSTAIEEYGFLLGGVVCVLVAIPLIVIGLAIFLVFVRTPLSKKLTRRNITIFCVIMVIILLIVPPYVVWPSISPTYKSTLRVTELSFSKNNEHLFVHTEGSNVITNASLPEFLATYQVWDLRTESLVWSTKNNRYPVIDLFHYNQIALSPDGEFLSFSGNNTLYSFQTKTYRTVPYGDFLGWLMNGTRFIVANGTQLQVWDATNMTLTKTIAFSQAARMIPSLDGSKIAVIPGGDRRNMLSVIDVASQNSSYLLNTTMTRSDTTISWSPDGTKLQLSYWIPQPTGDYRHTSYQVVVVDMKTASVIQNTSITYYDGSYASIVLSDIWFGTYATRDNDHHQIIVYNITTGEKEHVYSYDAAPSTAEWSPDKSLVGTSVSGGIIEIRNTSTGTIVQRLPLPVFELKRAIPDFETTLVFCAIALFVVLRLKKRTK